MWKSVWKSEKREGKLEPLFFIKKAFFGEECEG